MESSSKDASAISPVKEKTVGRSLRVSEWVQAQGGHVVGLSGFGGGKLASLADISFVAPSSFMPEVEDIHMALCHALSVNLADRIRAL